MIYTNGDYFRQPKKLHEKNCMIASFEALPEQERQAWEFDTGRYLYKRRLGVRLKLWATVN